MRLRNLIFALFLAVGAMGAVSCVSDGKDGANCYDSIEVDRNGDGVIDDNDCVAIEMNTPEQSEDLIDLRDYPFLENWGYDINTSVACGVLSDSGTFPGLNELEVIADDDTSNRPASPSTVNGYVSVSCESSGFFDVVEVPEDVMLLDEASGDTVYDPENGLLFVKTHRGHEDNLDNPKIMEGTSKGDWMSTYEKNYVEGDFYASLSSNSDEYFDRRDLRSDCRDLPNTFPNVTGKWRGVEVVDKKFNFTTAETEANVPKQVDTSVVTTTTTKVCVRQDTAPSSVKCYVNKKVDVPDGTPTGVAVDVKELTTEFVAIYNTDEPFDKVEPMAKDSDGNMKLKPTDDTPDVQFISKIGNDVKGTKLCNLFVEAAPAS